MLRIYSSAAANYDEQRLLRCAAPASQLAIEIRSCRIRMLRRPVRVRRAVQRACTDHDRVRARAQQSHDKAIVLASTRNDAIRFGKSRNRRDPVYALDEIGIDARRRKAERAAIKRLKFVGQIELGQARRFEQYFE